MVQVEETQAKMEDTMKLQLEKMSTDLEAARKAEVSQNFVPCDKWAGKLCKGFNT